MVEEAEFPVEVWCGVMRYVLQRHSWSSLSAVSSSFHATCRDINTWANLAVGLRPQDLETVGSRPRFESLVPLWVFCEKIFICLKDTHMNRTTRDLSVQCFSLVARLCNEVSMLVLRNWSFCERKGLNLVSTSFPTLQHLELSGCDQISNYDRVLPIFYHHPSLISFRATFSPRAKAGLDFSMAVPLGLMVLGFVEFDSAESLRLLLQRCQIQHLWFAATAECNADMRIAIHESCTNVVTLALPSRLEEQAIAQIVQGYSRLELLCRVGTNPALGTLELANDFEPLPDCNGIVVRRRGSSAQLACNGALWAPYSKEMDDLTMRTG